jgi:tetratricopeptide (TPR) repeat protein
VLVYALTIFTGAFLLFLVQPLIGKYILPWFGGVPAVWTTCMLFFQVLLLGGYAYAHFSSRRLKPRTQALVQLALVVAALALLPITPADSWKPDGTENPTLRILALLALSIGLPYFVLASTSPLMQHWFSRTNPNTSPYRLYALSNAGSLLALVSFPVFFETQFTRTTQARLWGWGLAVYAVSCSLCAIKLWKKTDIGCRVPGDDREKSATLDSLSRRLATSKRSEDGSEANADQPSTLDRLLWLLLPACASVLLLATTNKLCEEVAVIPFLWVLPLALYLLSFIICFDNPRWYVRLPFILALTAAASGICCALSSVTTSINAQLSIYSGGLFICCMVCHGELYRLKPDPKYLTGFYLMIAAGGALGGFFVAVYAPLIFTDYFELQFGLLFCVLLFLVVCLHDHNAGGFHRWRIPVCAWLSAGLAVLGAVLWLQAHKTDSGLIYRARNFYGVLKVFKYDTGKSAQHWLALVHGKTLHGLQFTDPSRSAWPTSYYNETSGVGLAWHALPTAPRRIGLVGLGIGTLTTYARTGDYIHIYEINPEVLQLATEGFKYLTNCPGQVEITLGDARLSLEREPAQNFDLLVLDAFNSDSIPVHLLTEEAFNIYERHLKTNGLIAVHVSNRNLNLEPVIANLARSFNYRLATVDYVPTSKEEPWMTPSVWILLSRTGAILDSPAVRPASRPPMTNSMSIRLWTDDFTSLFQILRSRTGPQNDPKFEGEQCQIAFNLQKQGNFAGAIAQLRHGLQIIPHSPVLLNGLAYLLCTCPDASFRNGAEAVNYAEHACELTHYRETIPIGTLAAAYAEVGQFDEAIATAQKACALAEKSGEQGLLKRNQKLLELYRAHQPYHEASEKLVPPAP